VKLSLTATPSQARFAPILWRGAPEPAFGLAAELGYDGVELHLRRPSDIDRVAVRRMARDLGLGIPMIGTGMAVEDGLTFSDPDAEVRRRAVVRLREQIELGVYLGAMAVIGSIKGKLGSDPEVRVNRLALIRSCCEECVRAAEAANTVLLIEAINRYETDYLNTLEEVASLIRAIGSPNLKLLVDTFHMNIEEVDIAASLRQAGGMIGHVHLVDTNREAPGHGHLDIPGVLSALSDVNYQGYLSLECLPLPDARRAAEDGIRTLRPLLQSLLRKPV
jgi:sugar phosphate isomerase/epimerase